MKHKIRPAFTRALFIALALFGGVSAFAQAPQTLGFQGRVTVSGVNFTGNGGFKFALVNAAGTTAYWSNDQSTFNGTEPLNPVVLPVTNGLYSVTLGDTTLYGPNMKAFPAGIFNNPDVRLRIWFSDGPGHGSQLLTPDQRLSSVAYAIVAGSAQSLAAGSVGSAQLASGLTLGGTTSGTFSGNLVGNAATATTAGSFSGTLAGDVTGSQAATTVANVGGVTAANVAAGATLANGAASANTGGTIIKRDGGGSFSAQSLTLNGDLDLPVTSGSSIGVISQNGNRLLFASGGGNFFAGPAVGNFTLNGTNNTGIGPAALQGLTSGNGNTALGFIALFANTAGDGNTAVGYGTLSANTTGPDNTALGYQALTAHLTGDSNTAIGYRALAANTTGNGNTAIGNSVLTANTTASLNVAIGGGALGAQSYSNSGIAWNSYNVAVGFAALNSNLPSSTANGVLNTALGASALKFNTTGSRNIAVGANAGFSLTTGDDNIDIGNTGVAGESNSIRIGTAGSHSATFIAGIRGIATGINQNVQTVMIDSNGQLGTIASSRRYKEDIADMGEASARITALRPVTFRYKKPSANGEKPVQFGLIAEEVAEVFPELTVYNAEGEPESVKYQDLAPLLLNEVQKLEAERDRLQEEGTALRAGQEEQRREIETLAGRLAELEALVKKAGAPPAAVRPRPRGASRTR